MLAELGLPVAAGDLVYAEGTRIPTVSATLVVADEANPQQGRVVAQAGTWQPLPTISTDFSAYYQQSVDSNGDGIDRRRRFTVYSKGGRLMKLEHRGIGIPEPQLWSSVDTSTICFVPGFMTHFQDDADPRRSYAFFRPPNASGKCDLTDFTTRAVRLDAGPGDPAITTGQPLAAIRSVDGSISGYVVQSGTIAAPGKVQRVDADLGNPREIPGMPALPISQFHFGSRAPGVWVFSFGASLYGLRLDDPAASPVELFNKVGLDPLRIRAARDGADAYVALGDRDKVTIVRIGEDLSAVMVGTVNAGGGATVDEIGTTDSQVIVRVGNTLRSIPKAGGVDRQIGQLVVLRDALASTPSAGSDPAVPPLRHFVTSGETVWYVTRDGSSATPRRVWHLRGDGSDAVSIDGAQWLTWSSPPVTRWGARPTAHTVYLAVDPTPGLLYSGAPVRAFDAGTAAPRFDVGRLPSSSLLLQPLDPTRDRLQFGAPGFVSYGLLGVENLLFFRSDGPGLQQVTVN